MSVVPPPAFSRADMILNPPGVKTMAREIQKPPYEDKAVAPNVLPAAISLHSLAPSFHSINCPWGKKIPHPRTKLHQSTIRKRRPNHNIRLRNVSRPHIDTPENKSRQRESRKPQWRGIPNLLRLNGPRAMQAGLQFTGKGRELSLCCVDTSERAIARVYVVVLGGGVVCVVGGVGGIGVVGLFFVNCIGHFGGYGWRWPVYMGLVGYSVSVNLTSLEKGMEQRNFNRSWGV